VHPFPAAAESGDHAAIQDMLAEDVTFYSPVAFKPYEGKAMVSAILLGAFRMFDGLHYVNRIENPDGRDAAFVFKATVGGRDVHGCDFIHLDEQCRIDEFTVMVRPLSAAKAVSEAMAEQFAIATREFGLSA
jgi:hypothetical protein